MLPYFHFHQIHKVPATDMEALKSPLMGLFEKRRARNFFVYVQNYNEADPVTHQGWTSQGLQLENWFREYLDHPGIVVVAVIVVPCCHVIMCCMILVSLCLMLLHGSYMILHLLWPFSAFTQYDDILCINNVHKLIVVVLYWWTAKQNCYNRSTSKCYTFS